MNLQSRNLFLRFSMLGLVIGSIGCGPYFRTPNFAHPGPTGPQRTEAIYHDPYPLDDVGPEIVGGRPQGYQRPVPETTRGRLLHAQPTTVVPLGRGF